MDIACTNCNSKFKIPDEKIPPDRAFAIACPKCKSKITVDPRQPASPEKAAEAKPSPPPPAPSEEEKSLFDEVAAGSYDSSEKPFDFVEEGVETALLCEPDDATRSKLNDALVSIGYQTTEPSSSIDALKKMRFHIFDLVVLNERFDTENPDESNVLKYLDQLSMEIRRQIFVALISDRFRTTDNMAAFNKSVNLTINSKNLDEFEKIVKRGVAENEGFYRVYRESMVNTGRV